MCGIVQLFFVFAVLRTVRLGEPAAAKAWERARGPEWEVDSPAQRDSIIEPHEGDVPGYR